MTTSTFSGTEWREIRREPWPACGHQGWCRVSPDGNMVACRRQPTGAILRRDYRDGPAWVHRVRVGTFTASAPLPPARPGAPRAADADLDAVYTALLAVPELCLQRLHRDQLLGLVARPDVQDDGKKYVWVSSTWCGGPSPGSRVHVPIGATASDRVAVMEGILKANVVRALSGRTVLGLPGCNFTHEAVQALRALSAKQVLLALDADATENEIVARAQFEGLQRLKMEGFDAGLLRWDPADGKGLDDYLLSCRQRRAKP
jgi:Domain of unknown function (DUF3854)